LRISKKIIEYYKTKIPEECQLTKNQFEALKLTITRKETESFKSIVESLKIKEVHFNSAVMIALFKIRKFLEKEGFNKNQIKKITNLIFN